MGRLTSASSPRAAWPRPDPEFALTSWICLPGPGLPPACPGFQPVPPYLSWEVCRQGKAASAHMNAEHLERMGCSGGHREAMVLGGVLGDCTQTTPTAYSPA